MASVVITNQARERLLLLISTLSLPGDLARQRVENGRLVVEFTPRPHRESLLGAIHEYASSPIEDWHGLTDAACAARSREITGR